MFAIMVEDYITEKNRVMSTLATDMNAANIIMLATANGWCEEQDVNLGYILDHQEHEGIVQVFAGKRIVLRCSTQTITSCISSSEISTYIMGGRPTEH